MDDWRTQLAIAYKVREAIHQVDRQGLWPFRLPRVAAPGERVLEVEEELGFALDEQHRQFLGHADGWECFYQAATLFGCPDLVSPAWQDRTRALADEVNLAVQQEAGVSMDATYVIAASEQDVDVFLIGRPDTARQGEVFWVAGQLIDTYPSFDEFFLAMVDYNRHVYQKLNGS